MNVANFRNLELSDWDNLVALGTVLYFSDKKLIIQQGDPITDIFCLMQGRALIVKVQQNGTAKNIAIQGAYSFLGIEQYIEIGRAHV